MVESIAETNGYKPEYEIPFKVASSELMWIETTDGKRKLVETKDAISYYADMREVISTAFNCLPSTEEEFETLNWHAFKLMSDYNEGEGRAVFHPLAVVYQVNESE